MIQMACFILGSFLGEHFWGMTRNPRITRKLDHALQIHLGAAKSCNFRLGVNFSEYL
jgi:hypothetical protein